MRYLTVLIFIFLSWQSERSIARQLRIVTIPVEPYYRLKSDNSCEGFLIDLTDDLIQRANSNTSDEVTYRFYRVPDSKFGSKNENGRWNGMIGEVVDGNADMAVAPITITKARSEVVYFSHPFMPAMIVPLVLKPAPGSPMPFNNLTDLLSKVESNELTIGYLRNSSTETFLSEHKIEEVRAVYNLTKSSNIDNPILNYQRGIDKVRQSNGRYVFFGEHNAFAKVSQSQPCDSIVAWSVNLGTRYAGFAFPKTTSGRQWRDKFNELIVEAEEDGTIAKLTYIWWDLLSHCSKPKMCNCRLEN